MTKIVSFNCATAHLINLDPIGYLRAEDDITYTGYLSYVARRNPYDIIVLYLVRTILR